MSQPEQHLPEKFFPCGGCGQVFKSATDFSDHFTRLTNDGEPTINITGCFPVPMPIESRRATKEKL